MKLKWIACAAALAMAFGAHAQQGSRTLKMQSSWPASAAAQDHFKIFAERLDKLSGGQLKVEVMAAGQIVPAFEVLDATSKKVIDGFHS
ncbi:MAG TPA: C4-dicarboxylate ABC transporter, partial [Burkholderiales bacterium]|nr:C4-dicarboxylate ABC transporter [Burkholderiales bacterium]